MKPKECQCASLQGVAEGRAEMPPKPFIVHLKRFLRRHLNSRQERTLRRWVDAITDCYYSITGQENPALNKPVTIVHAEPLKAGDLVRVKSKEEILATLDRHGKVKGCAYMDAMDPYCGTTQRVLKSMERFVDERELRVKKCKGLILLDGVMCQGVTDFGRCDRCCFMFWREEWLEKIEPYITEDSPKV